MIPNFAKAEIKFLKILIEYKIEFWGTTTICSRLKTNYKFLKGEINFLMLIK